MKSIQPQAVSTLSGFTGPGRAPRRPEPIGPSSTVSRRAVIASALVYVAAWLAGLAVLPTGVDPHAGPAEVSTVLADNATAAVIQSWLVHGVAAIALLCLVGSALRMLAAGPHVRIGSTVTWLAAVGAAAASVLQVALLHAAVAAATATTRDVAAAFFRAVNVTDMIKLVLLGTVVGGLTIMLARAGAPRWFGWLALSLAGLLPLAGLAFVSEAPVLGGMLAASLVLLLGWALVAAVFTVRLSEPADGRAVVKSRRETR
ncbi:MAG TPA: hypothetical protein VIJ00_15455 [Nakamurella sp.]